MHDDLVLKQARWYNIHNNSNDNKNDKKLMAHEDTGRREDGMNRRESGVQSLSLHRNVWKHTALLAFSCLLL